MKMKNILGTLLLVMVAQTAHAMEAQTASPIKIEIHNILPGQNEIVKVALQYDRNIQRKDGTITNFERFILNSSMRPMTAYFDVNAYVKSITFQDTTKNKTYYADIPTPDEL